MNSLLTIFNDFAAPFLGSHYREFKYLFLFYLVISFLALTITLFIIVIFHRGSKTIKAIRDEKVFKLFQSVITTVMFYEPDDVLYEKELNHFQTNYLNKDRANKDMLIAEILKLNSQLSGDITIKLHDYYISSGLVNYSYDLLNNKKWHTQARGIRQLSDMAVLEAYDKIAAKISTGTRLLNHEAQLGILRIKGPEALNDFLHIKTYLSEWQQINILSIIDKFEKNTFPDFRPWLSSPNHSLIQMGVRLIVKFQQVDAIDNLILLLHHEDESIKKITIWAMGELFVDSVIPTLIEHFEESSDSIKIEILQAISKMGNDDCLAFLKEKITNSDFNIKLEAARSIKLLFGISTLNELQPEMEDETTKLIIEQVKTENL
ncbi:HEAT repeat domain-containing protein [Limnovirga soli]|uniref:HEAT repeat domain-containing protein n=1 Tax=Limnovirga soli TaxID=2656915 RepID=A0A8J8JUR8_9BACT|nr:HEAT repeat domain-containing protein [Limnovirga soli]NNV55864.1 hypothetical protein [Limnovirga soli]